MLSNQSTEASTGPAIGPVTDARGTPHPRAGARSRIVSLVPSLTELLFDLGLGDQLIGRTTFCIHPATAVAGVPRVGGTKTPNLQRILELAPTHAVMNVDENLREHAEVLERAGVSIIATHPVAPEDNVELYRMLGYIFGRDQEAKVLEARFRDRFDAVEAELEAAAPRRSRRRVLYLIWRKPWMTVSPDTYISRMLGLAGLDTTGPNLPARYPEIGAEVLAELAVDAVLFSSEPYPFKTRHFEELLACLELRRVPCLLVDGEMLSWFGSRAIQGLDYLRILSHRLESVLASSAPPAEATGAAAKPSSIGSRSASGAISDQPALTAPSRVPSPCIQVCRMDARERLCVGCLRTLEEIGGWSGMSDDQRRQVLERVARRRTGHPDEHS